ncbi:hypothetical protein CN559_30610 [Bacillus pseudomycoides]|nr:hypothetical protein CN559_30610 [Bacillus pseudomycoides]
MAMGYRHTSINLTEQVTPKTKKMNFVSIKDTKFTFRGYFKRFWCKNKIKENKAHIFLTESYLMLQVQTIDG